MKNFVPMVLTASALAFVAPAYAQSVPMECGFAEDAPIFGVGMAAGTDPTPILAPMEKGIVERGDRSASLRSIRVPATRIDGWTTDYAIMRLSQVAGKPIWAVTESGLPGEPISLDIPETTLADALDRVVAAKNMRWRYDGDKVYVLGGREWSIPMPANRDVALAVRAALVQSGLPARIEGGAIRFHADDRGAAKVSAVVSDVYAQSRLNPYDVQFYRVFPSRGAIDWSALAVRTESVEAVSFDGKGATVILDPTSGSVVDAFLAREGAVRSLGATTIVSPKTGAGTVHIAGCGAQADPARGLELTGGAFDRGKVALRYAITGGAERQAGSMSVVPGSVVVIADGEPREGAYMVAVVRPRVIELQGAGSVAVVTAPAPVAAAAPAPLRRVEMKPDTSPAVRMVEVQQKPAVLVRQAPTGQGSAETMRMPTVRVSAPANEAVRSSSEKMDAKSSSVGGPTIELDIPAGLRKKR